MVIPLSIISLLLGCRSHKDLPVALLGFAGLTKLIVTATLGHDHLGEGSERIATLNGASAMTAADRDIRIS